MSRSYNSRTKITNANLLVEARPSFRQEAMGQGDAERHRGFHRNLSGARASTANQSTQQRKPRQRTLPGVPPEQAPRLGTCLCAPPST
jgi:hypothetical protein